MKKFFRRKRNWIIILLLLILAPFIYGYVMISQFNWNEKEISEFFKDKKMQPEYNSYKLNGRSVFYVSMGNETMPMVIFIHGAPGSWTDYIKYFADTNLTSKVHVIALDRPGYGKSDKGNYVTSIDSQVELIKPLLALNKSQKGTVISGHSYGGPIAARMAMLYPDEVKGLLLLAPAIDPDNEKQFAINKLAGLKVVQWMMPKMWLTAYYEKKTHVDELRKMDSDWNWIISPTIYMFGEKDGIVPPVNADYAKRKMTNGNLEVITFPNENHFIPWTQQDSVTKVILKLIAE